MRTVVFAITITLIAGLAASADAPAKVTLDLRDAQLKEAVDDISRQSGASIVVDPKAEGTVTASLDKVELTQALDVVTSTNDLTWKKLQFARQEDSKVSLEQLKSGVLALATMSLVGLSVEDPTTKTSAVFAKDLAASPDVSGIGLPEGYAWTTVYVILAAETPPGPASATGTADVGTVAKAATQTMLEVANMTPAQRQQFYASELTTQLSLTEDARRAMLRDRMTATFELDPEYRDLLRHDMREVFRDIRRTREAQGLSVPGHADHRRGSRD